MHGSAWKYEQHTLLPPAGNRTLLHLCIWFVLHSVHMYMHSVHLCAFFHKYALCAYLCILCIWSYVCILCICVHSMHIRAFFTYLCILCTCVHSLCICAFCASMRILCICVHVYAFNHSVHMWAFGTYVHILCVCMQSVHTCVHSLHMCAFCACVCILFIPVLAIINQRLEMEKPVMASLLKSLVSPIHCFRSTARKRYEIHVPFAGGSQVQWGLCGSGDGREHDPGVGTAAPVQSF